MKRRMLVLILLGLTVLFGGGNTIATANSARDDADKAPRVAGAGVQTGSGALLLPFTPAGGGFTYQGRLNVSGSPATGQFDLTFALFDASGGGHQIGATVTVANQAVTDGLLTANLDFGPSAFQGDARWLEIAVRQAGVGSYTTLSPRQPLSAAPYASSLVPGAVISGTGSSPLFTVSNSGSGPGAYFSGTTGSGITAVSASGSAISGSSNLGSGVSGTSGSSTGVTGISGTGYGVYGSSGGIGVYGYGNGASPAVEAQNTGTGYALYAENNSSTRPALYATNLGSSYGIEAHSTGSNAIYGLVAHSGAAIFGNNTGSGTGVYGSGSTGYGVYGYSPDGKGVAGYSTNDYGVWGTGINNFGVYGQTSDSSFAGVYGTAAGGSGVWGNSSTGYGGRFVSTSGTGVYVLGGNAVYGEASSSNGTGLWGVANTGTSARGVYGSSTSGSGVMGRSTATNGEGVYGEANTGTSASGVYGSSTSGYGVYGTSAGGDAVHAVNTGSGEGLYAYSASGTGVYAISGDGSDYAIQAFSNGRPALRADSNSSTDGAVHGENTVGSGIYGRGAPGVYGTSSSSTGVGVYGEADSASAAGVKAWSDHGYGLYAFTGDGYAVYAVQGTSGAGNYAGYFSGNVHVNGSLSKLSGSFKIDDPIDPENKYLYHSFVESPDMKNIYDGVAALDANGEAWVEMPAWFDALNEDFRYQLTCIGGYAPVYVAEEMKENRFKISGGKAGMKVSWQVTGIRHDPYAEAHRIPVEEAKPDGERGKYLTPLEYGQPETKGIGYEQQQPLNSKP